MPSKLLATKFYRPAPPSRQVRRPQLVRRLNAGLAAGHQFTLVSAPAGFGKTTCVGEWVNSLTIPAAWLSLDPADDEPVRFFAYFVAALQKVDETIGREMADALSHTTGQPPPIEFLLTTLVNDLSQASPFVLVLDDWHVIHETIILKALEQLVANQPANMHLVLVAREDPPLPLARLRANNRMTELRAGDLRFTHDEVDRFLNERMELGLAEAEIAALENRTEGWVVGLQLAALALQASPSARNHAGRSAFISQLTGSHRYILSYLTEQVLDQQTNEIARFLLQTSILDKLSGDLCDAVTGRTDSAVLLERLFAANLFLVPLDDEQRWFRYHHLFADLLSNRLRQALPDREIEELHDRASRWFEQNDLRDEAIDHVLQGKNYERAALLVEQAAGDMMFAGRANALRNWLAALSPASFQARPRLSIYRLWIDLMQGKSDLSEPALQEDENLLSALPPSPENDRLRVELMVVLCRFAALAGHTVRAIRLAERALAGLPDAERASRARAYSALAIAHFLEGRPEQGEPVFQECLRLAQASGNYSLAAHTLMLLGMGHLNYGRLHEAARSYQNIIDLGAQAGQKVFFPAGQGYIGLAGIYLEWNDLPTAQDYLKRGIELCSQGGLAGVATGHTLTARLLQARGDLQGALAEARLAQTIQPGVDPAAVARHILIELALGETAEAARLAHPGFDLLNHNQLPLLVREELEALLIRVLIAQDELERAMQLLDQLQATAGPGKRSGRILDVYLLRALALYKRQRGIVTPAVRESLQHALALAEPEGYILLFVEEGPALRPLLRAVAAGQAHPPHPVAPERLRKYAQKLLSAFPTCPAPGALGSSATAVPGELVEPLSPRELEVLHLMADGLTYQEVAQHLVVTVNTVRFHVKSIYSKLGVAKRAAALDKARALGLL